MDRTTAEPARCYRLSSLIDIADRYRGHPIWPLYPFDKVA